jgi:hypothetical protein
MGNFDRGCIAKKGVVAIVGVPVHVPPVWPRLAPEARRPELFSPMLIGAAFLERDGNQFKLRLRRS